jgi:hypothetical protein
VIAGVRIFDTIAASKSGASLFLIMMSLPEERSLLEESLYPIEKRQLGWATLFVTPSPKKNDGATGLSMTNLSLIRGSHQARRLQKVI